MLGWAFAAKRLEHLAWEALSEQPPCVGFYVWENGSPTVGHQNMEEPQGLPLPGVMNGQFFHSSFSF
jgi:hypothetical protein